MSCGKLPFFIFSFYKKGTQFPNAVTIVQDDSEEEKDKNFWITVSHPFTPQPVPVTLTIPIPTIGILFNRWSPR
jgi:hypothetical protein